MPQWRTLGGTDIRRFEHDIQLHTGIEYHPFESAHDLLIRWFQRPRPGMQFSNLPQINETNPATHLTKEIGPAPLEVSWSRQ